MSITSCMNSSAPFLKCKMAVFVVLALVGIVAPARADDDLVIQTVHDGRLRSFMVHVPLNSNSATPLPLVIVIHGGGGSMEGMAQTTGMNATADREKFIAVYPQGVGEVYQGQTFGTWNGGLCCGKALAEDIDDVGFISAMIDYLQKNFAIDAKRIYATGLSNGAQMSYRLACELANKIAAVAPHSGQGDMSACTPVRNIPVLNIHGKKDPCTVYDGTKPCGGCFDDFLEGLGLPVGQKEYWQCDAVETAFDKWRTLNGCSNQATVTNYGSHARCTTFKGCSNNSETTLCSDDDLGHNWAGSFYGIPACETAPNGYVCKLWWNTVGPASDNLHGNDLIWNFFKRHTLDDGTPCSTYNLAAARNEMKGALAALLEQEVKAVKLLKKASPKSAKKKKTIFNKDQEAASLVTQELNILPDTLNVCERSACQKVDIGAKISSYTSLTKQISDHIKNIAKSVKKYGTSKQAAKAKTISANGKKINDTQQANARTLPASYVSCSDTAR